ncbi:polyphosphate kinase 2 [Psychrobacter fulvigenes]|uniref:polyphosphate kinase 2 n=1 Tax=Psychrobacter fulvigenes TaxID=533323 RepID=UPI002234147E|nr:polyphosphate kinase 2 [Psychrobacter fulvigenes]
MSRIPSTTNPESLTPQEYNELSKPERNCFIGRMDKEIFNDELRRKMHQDLIDSYDEELENEIDDYVRDFRFDGIEVTEQERIDRRTYFQELLRLQRELIKLQDWVVEHGERIVVIFEGRDSAGKGGAIKRITQRLNPRVCRVAALPAPTEREQSQWYFQRYVAHLPAAGEIVLFDRSWYNRVGVERVMGFCTDAQYEEFFQSVPEFERMLVRSGIRLVKYWFSITDDEQHSRFMSRIHDPLKQWKLSAMDLQSRRRWEDYTKAKETMFERTHIPEAPWWVVEGNNKKRARLNCIAHLLDQIPYKEIPREEVELPDRKRDDEYYREPIPDDMYVPPRY